MFVNKAPHIGWDKGSVENMLKRVFDSSQLNKYYQSRLNVAFFMSNIQDSLLYVLYVAVYCVIIVI
jgi:hypothetical protein